MSSIFQQIFGTSPIKKKDTGLGNADLKQGQRFNYMQNAITAEVLPALPLMEQTTGPGLGSIVESLENISSDGGYIRRQDDMVGKLALSEFKKLEKMEDQYEALIRQLQALDAQTQSQATWGSGAPMQNPFVKAFNETGCPNKNVNAATLNYWKSRDDKGSADMLSYCTKTKDGSASQVQKDVCCGTGNSCDLPKMTCSSSHVVTGGSAGSTDTSHNDEANKLKQQISVLNGKIMTVANKLIAQTRKTNSANSRTQSTRSEQQLKLRHSLNALLDKKGGFDSLMANRATLTGQLEDRRLDLNASYLHYLTWFVSAITLAAVAGHQILKNT